MWLRIKFYHLMLVFGDSMTYIFNILYLQYKLILFKTMCHNSESYFFCLKPFSKSDLIADDLINNKLKK